MTPQLKIKDRRPMSSNAGRINHSHNDSSGCDDAYKHMADSSNSWDNRLTNNDSRRIDWRDAMRGP